jgi:outer membrane lipoprotein-sorting protein
MRPFCLAVLLGILCAQAQAAQQPTSTALDDLVAKIITRENAEMVLIRQRSPLIETYIQKTKTDGNVGNWQPNGDNYFIGRAKFSKGLQVESLPARNDKGLRHILIRIDRYMGPGIHFLPQGFLQTIFLDSRGLDAQSYNFQYVRREFLGEVRTLVFNVRPAAGKAKGRFAGRIWVEDENYTIVRFNGTYSRHDLLGLKFHFDSWRVNTGPNLWLPAFIYTEQDIEEYPWKKAQNYKSQTRLWGYDAGQSRQEEELSKVLIESTVPVVDKTQQENALSPIEENRAWQEQAQNNVIDKLQEIGLVAPKGEIDKILETVVNNLEVTNNLNFDPDVHCRVLMTSTIESFTVGRTIVLSRGLIDVLPDEASLAMALARELGYITLDRPFNTLYAFYDPLVRFDEKKTFQHFDYSRRPEDDEKANAKAAELLKNSPYKDQLGTAQEFTAELQARSREIPNLISPRLGDVILPKNPEPANTEEKAAAVHIVALPLGGRVKLNPWDDSLELLKSPPIGTVSEFEKMPFEVTPFVIYLTRVRTENPKTSQSDTPEKPGL